MSNNKIICESPSVYIFQSWTSLWIIRRIKRVATNPTTRSSEVDLNIAQDEITRAHRLAPHVVPKYPADETISHIIGIRPSRRGGYRLDSVQSGQRTILSAYGFGGGGYAFSYGVADALVKMVEESERKNVIV